MTDEEKTSWPNHPKTASKPERIAILQENKDKIQQNMKLLQKSSKKIIKHNFSDGLVTSLKKHPQS